MITLFWCPQTRASRILWLLGELGQPFEVLERGLGRGPPTKRRWPGTSSWNCRSGFSRDCFLWAKEVQNNRG
jgi:hypothetical protein